MLERKYTMQVCKCYYISTCVKVCESKVAHEHLSIQIKRSSVQVNVYVCQHIIRLSWKATDLVFNCEHTLPGQK